MATDAYVDSIALPLVSTKSYLFEETFSGFTATKWNRNYIIKRELFLVCHVRKTSVTAPITQGEVKFKCKGANGSGIVDATINEIKYHHYSSGTEGKKRVEMKITLPTDVIKYTTIESIGVSVGNSIVGNTIISWIDFKDVFTKYLWDETVDKYFISDVYGNTTYQFKNYYDSAPTISVSGKDTSGKTGYKYHYENIYLTVNYITNPNILGYTSLSKQQHYYKIFCSTDNKNYTLYKTISVFPSSNSNYSFTFSNDLKNKRLYFKIQYISPFQIINGETNIGPYSNVVYIDAFPVPTFSISLNSNFLVRPHRYASFFNKTFTYTPTIAGTFNLTVNSSITDYTNYLSISEATIDNRPIKLNKTVVQSTSYSASFSESGKQELSDKILTINIKNKLGNSYTVKANIEKYVREYEPLAINEKAFSIFNSSNSYEGKIINPDEYMKLKIDKRYIYDPRTGENLQDNESLKFQIHKRVVSLEGSENADLTGWGWMPEENIPLFHYDTLLGDTLLGDKSKEETWFCYIYISTQFEDWSDSQNLYYKIKEPVRLGRIKGPIKFSGYLQEKFFCYTLLDNGGDRNSNYNYEYFYSKYGETSLSRTTKQKIEIELTLKPIKSEANEANGAKEITINYIVTTAEESGDLKLPLQEFRNYLRENQEKRLYISDLDEVDISLYKSAEVKISYYYNLSGTESINSGDEAISIPIKSRIPLLTPRKGGIGINCEPTSDQVLKVMPGITDKFDSSGKPIIADRVQFWNLAGTRYFQIRLDGVDGAPLLSFGRYNKDKDKWQYITWKLFPNEDAAWQDQKT